MNATRILTAADAAGIDLPEPVTKLRAALYAIAESDIPPRPMPTAQELGRRVLDETLRTGAVPDVMALVAEARLAADSVVGYQAVEAVAESGAGRLENLVRANLPALVVAVREAIEQVWLEVDRLPRETPTEALSAVNGTPAGIAAFKKLQGLAERYRLLKAIHLAILEDTVPAALAFTDTKLPPRTADGKSYTPAGPRDPLARLRWLATPESQSWIPSSAECTAQYSTWRADVSAAGAGQRPTPAKAG